MPVTERIVRTQRICHAAGLAERLALCIVPVFYHPGFGAVNQWEDGGESAGHEKAGASAEAPARLRQEIVRCYREC